MLEIGDTIDVKFPESAGITLTKRGTIAERRDTGRMRNLLTDKGAVLLAWEPGKHHVKVTLIDRPPARQQQLPLEMFDEVRERLAS